MLQININYTFLELEMNLESKPYCEVAAMKEAKSVEPHSPLIIFALREVTVRYERKSCLNGVRTTVNSRISLRGIIIPKLLITR